MHYILLWEDDGDGEEAVMRMVTVILIVTGVVMVQFVFQKKSLSIFNFLGDFVDFD